MPSQSALGGGEINTPPPKITLKGELARYDAREPTGGMDARRRVVRAQAKAIIEGRTKWPRDLLAWKARREHAYWHGDGPANPWEDSTNLTPPQRERELFHDRACAAIWTRFHKAVAAGDAAARVAARDAMFALHAREMAR